MERDRFSRGSYGVYVAIAGCRWLLWDVKWQPSSKRYENPVTATKIHVTATR